MIFIEHVPLSWLFSKDTIQSGSIDFPLWCIPSCGLLGISSLSNGEHEFMGILVMTTALQEQMLRTSPCGFQSIPPFISISVVPRVSYYTFHPETHFQFLLTPFEDGAHASHHVSFLDIPFSFNAPTRLKDGVTDLLRLCAEADNAITPSLPRKCEGETRPRKCKEKSSFPATLKNKAFIRGAQTCFFLAAHLHTSTQLRCPWFIQIRHWRTSDWRFTHTPLPASLRPGSKARIQSKLNLKLRPHGMARDILKSWRASKLWEISLARLAAALRSCATAFWGACKKKLAEAPKGRKAEGA